MRNSLIIAAAAALVATSVGVFATSNKGEHSGHDANNMTNMDADRAPTEAGQSAFAAIAEIVAMLEADKNTDWTQVNIRALRDHLLDMNDVTMRSQVSITNVANDFTFTITGIGPVSDAIKRMVPAHAKELDKMSDWSASTIVIANGVELKMTPVDEDAAIKIAALGFYGLLATGAHHQPHHFGMANGSMVH